MIEILSLIFLVFGVIFAIRFGWYAGELLAHKLFFR